MPAHSHPEKNLALNRPRQPSLQAISPFSVVERSSPELLNWLKSAGVTGKIQGSTRLIQEGEQQQLATLPPGSLVGEMRWLEQRS